MIYAALLNFALLGTALSFTYNGPTIERSALVADEVPQPREWDTACGQRRSSVSLQLSRFTIWDGTLLR